MAIFVTGFIFGVLIWAIGRDLERHDKRKRDVQTEELLRWSRERTDKRIAEIRRQGRAMRHEDES